uniref:Uncharacterized protein n=1 Tax=Oryza glumipatula TaxID=40148 RepID=A0A0D9ZWP1_9ORYZ
MVKPGVPVSSVVPLDRNLRWPLLAGCLRRLGCLPVLVVKSALRRLRSTTFLHTKTFTLDFGILWFKAFRLLAEWHSREHSEGEHWTLAHLGSQDSQILTWNFNDSHGINAFLHVFIAAFVITKPVSTKVHMFL